MKKSKLESELKRLKEDVLKLSERLNGSEINSSILESSSMWLPISPSRSNINESFHISEAINEEMRKKEKIEENILFSLNNNKDTINNNTTSNFDQKETSYFQDSLHNTSIKTNNTMLLNTSKVSKTSNFSKTSLSSSKLAELDRAQRKIKKLELQNDKLLIKVSEMERANLALQTKIDHFNSEEVDKLKEENEALKLSLQRSEEVRVSQNKLILLLQKQGNVSNSKNINVNNEVKSTEEKPATKTFTTKTKKSLTKRNLRPNLFFR